MDLGVSTELIVALISGVLSILAGVVSTSAARRARRFEAELEKQRARFEFELAQQAKLEDEAHQAERILHQYRDPLLDAAHTLQGRIYNIVEKSYLARYLHCGDPAEERYARDYTVYAVAEYLCWVEIVRRELRFRDLGDVDRNRQFLTRLSEAQKTLQTDSTKSPMQVFRGRQRAIAEVMMTPTNAPEGPRYECLGYATFCQRLDTDAEFAGWFERIRHADIDALARGGADAYVRLIRLHHNLIDLIDFLDPDRIRIRPDDRQRMTTPEASQAPGPGVPVVAATAAAPAAAPAVPAPRAGSAG